MAILKYWNGSEWIELYSDEIDELRNRCYSLNNVDILVPASTKVNKDMPTQLVNQTAIADEGVGEYKSDFPYPAVETQTRMKISEAVQLLTRYAHHHDLEAGTDVTAYQCQCQCRCDCQCDCNCDCNCCTHCVHAPPCVFYQCACYCDCNCNCACGDGACSK